MKQSIVVDVHMEDWISSGDFDNLTVSSTRVLAPDGETQRVLNGANWPSDHILRFRAATPGTSRIEEENHNPAESFGLMVVVS